MHKRTTLEPADVDENSANCSKNRQNVAKIGRFSGPFDLEPEGGVLLRRPRPIQLAGSTGGENTI